MTEITASILRSLLTVTTGLELLTRPRISASQYLGIQLGDSLNSVSVLLHRSWQLMMFEPLPVTFIKIVGTRNSANEVSLSIFNMTQFHSCCVHCRCSIVYTSRHRQFCDCLHFRKYLVHRIIGTLTG